MVGKTFQTFYYSLARKKSCTYLRRLAALSANYLILQSVNSNIDSNIIIFFESDVSLATHKLRLECADNNNKL